MALQYCNIMKIATRYNNGYRKECEPIDDTLVTDQSQFISLGTIVRRTLAGEIMDVVNWSNRNPIERADKFDVLDAADRMNREMEKQQQNKLEKPQEPEKPQDPDPSSTPSPEGE